LHGSGCPKCGKISMAETQKFSKDKFVQLSKKIHGDRYDYSKVEYIGSKSKVCIVCKEHGEFFQTPSAHINLKQGCPRCNESHLEKKIRTDLKNNNIEFIPECSKDVFPWLKLQKLDFYLPKYNIAIECQGEQHFKPIEFWGGDKGLKEQIERDERKFNLCESNRLNILYYTTIEVPKSFNHEYFDKNKMLKVINDLVMSE
jgi:hypothetical protein